MTSVRENKIQALIKKHEDHLMEVNRCYFSLIELGCHQEAFDELSSAISFLLQQKVSMMNLHKDKINLGL